MCSMTKTSPIVAIELFRLARAYRSYDTAYRSRHGRSPSWLLDSEGFEFHFTMPGFESPYWFIDRISVLDTERSPVTVWRGRHIWRSLFNGSPVSGSAHPAWAKCRLAISHLERHLGAETVALTREQAFAVSLAANRALDSVTDPAEVADLEL